MTDIVTISEPPCNGLIIGLSSSNVSCFNGSDGVASVFVMQYNAPSYSILWSTGSSAPSISSLTQGNYWVQVTDGANCQKTINFTITQPSKLSIALATTNVKCKGNNNGSINATITGGTFPYTYSWSNNALVEDIAFLLAGSYQLTVTDSKNCTASSSTTVTEPMDSLRTSTLVTNVSCYNGSDGAIDLTVTGGTPSYTYSWLHGPTTQDVTGLIASSYVVFVKDANNCNLPLPLIKIITEPDTMELSSSMVSIACPTAGATTTSVTFAPIGGTAPYQISTNNGTSYNTSGLYTLSLNIGATYNVLVKDAKGCILNAAYSLVIDPAVVLSGSSFNPCIYSPSTSTSVTFTPGGGTGPYQISTNNGSTFAAAGVYTFTLNAATSYQIVVKDSKGCLSIAYTVNIPAVMSTSVTSPTFAGGFNISCNGSNTGSVNLTVTGGTSPYTYSWNTTPVRTTEDISNLTSGTYSVLVTDNNGCTRTSSITLTQPPVVGGTATVTSNYNGTQISCYGASNGSINASGSGGVSPYTYTWSTTPVRTTATITGLPAGSYTVTIKDANGCTTTRSVTITQPAQLTSSIAVSSNYNGQNISCNGASNGAINLTPSGGNTGFPYTFSWTPGANTTEDISNLTAGTYSVLITDKNNCTAVNSITLSQPNVLNASAVVTSNYNGAQISCNGLSDGAVNTTGVNGGTAPYTYTWSTTPSSSTAAVSGLPAGTYTVTVKDVNNCTVTASVTISQPQLLTSSASVTSNYNGQNVSCNGSTNGSVTVSGTGGVTPFAYSWSTGGTTQSISGVGAGTYTVVTTDVNSCTTSTTVTVSEPALLTTSAAATTNYNGYNISCYGYTDGQAAVTTTGGVTAYTYLWSNGQTTATATGLNAATFSVTVTDKNGCISVASVTLTQPPVFASTISVTSNYNGQQISCNGVSDGAIDLSITGGNPAFTYSWSNGATTEDISGLAAGTYSVVATDANGCTISNSVTISQPPALNNTLVVSSNYNGQNISCNGLSDASLNLTVTGGTPLIFYSWSTGATTEDISNLPVGTYSVLITDVNGCSQTNSITVSQPPALGSTLVVSSAYNGQDVSCFGASDGAADLTVSGGTPALNYSWSNGATTQDLNSIPAGQYIVLITDVNGCTLSDTVTLTQPPALTSSLVISSNYNGQNISCFGLSDGSLDLTVNGGTPAITYSWNTGATTQDVSNLPAGTYTVVSTDVNGCSVTNTITIAQPPALSNTLVVSSNYNGQNISCFGLSDGSLDLTISGGTPGFVYSWNTGDTTQDISNIPAGQYIVVVTDTNNCSITDTINVTQPTLLTSALVVSTNYNGQNISCNGLNDGAADLTISGGTPAYSYTWSNNATTQDISNLTAGTYIVNVQDVNGCSLSDTITLTQPPALSDSLAITSNFNGQNISCNGAADGAVDLTVAGGSGSYNYSWSNGATTQDLNNIPAGTYIVTVSDTNGCIIKDTVTLTQPAVLVATAAVINVDCYGFNTGSVSMTPAGGTTPYSYSWSNTATTQNITGVGAGSYIVVITDVNGCTFSDTNTVNQNTIIAQTYIYANAKCNGDMNGYIDITPVGGIAPYTYSWSNGSTAQDAYGLTAGIYTLAITDSKGCVLTDTFTITEPAVLTGTLSPYFYPNGFNVSLFNQSDGSVDLTITGGTLPYSIFWSNGTTAEDLSNVPAGLYSVIVQDSNGCIFNANVLLKQPFNLELPTGITPNNDGLNDYFIIHGIESYPNNVLEIYNRWGNIVYDVKGYTNDWNGVNNSGEELPTGTYFVVFTINDNGEKVVLKGYVDLRRK